MIAKHYVVGKWLVREFRSYLNGLKFLGYEIDWHEEKSWFEHQFFVKGDVVAMSILDSHIEKQATESN